MRNTFKGIIFVLVLLLAGQLAIELLGIRRVEITTTEDGRDDVHVTTEHKDTLPRLLDTMRKIFDTVPELIPDTPYQQAPVSGDAPAPAAQQPVPKAAAPEMPAPEASETEVFYRVRRSWEDAASQDGAYHVYENAVENCPAGYCVFDEDGTVLYCG